MFNSVSGLDHEGSSLTRFDLTMDQNSSTLNPRDLAQMIIRSIFARTSPAAFVLSKKTCVYLVQSSTIARK